MTSTDNSRYKQTRRNWSSYHALHASLIVVAAMHNTAAAFSGPIALNVKVSVQPERRNEFLAVIQEDAKQTVHTEPGALQFTLGEDTETSNTFYFHEQYIDMPAFEHHQSTPHFLKWKEFCDTEPFTAETIVTIYQCNHTPERITPRPAYCLNVELCIKPEIREEFLVTIAQNQKGSQQDEPLCFQYDFGESVDTPNSFYFHEEYKGREGFDAHAASPHFQVWEKFAAKGPFTKPPVVEFYQTV